ncbi:MAG TPA: PAS domain S-box protein [Anaerolineales bacterium]|nr:PAS domain S-box protein [Anaerolineales bacterium]
MSLKTQRKTNAASVSDKVKPARKTRSSASKNHTRSNGKHPLANYEHLHVGIVECSLEGNYIDVNEEFCRILGYSKDELLQMGIRQCTHEDDYALDIKLHGQLVEGKIPYYGLEKRFIRKDGRAVWVELTRSLVRDVNGKPIRTMGVVIDISEYKHVERVLRESAENLRLATEAARMFKWELDFQRQLYTFADNFAQVLGFSASLLPQNSVETVWSLSPEEDVQVISKAINEAVGNHTNLNSLQYRMVDPQSGQVAWLEVNAKIVYDSKGDAQRMFGVAQNITERKYTEKTLAEFARQQEALYQLSDQLHHTNSLEEVYNAALNAILSGLQCDRASILLFGETGVMQFVAWRGLSEQYRKATEGHSPWGPDERNPYPLCVGAVGNSDLSDSLKATIQKEGIVSLAFIPLVSNGKLIGKFMVYFDIQHECSDNEIELGLMIARQLAFAIDQKRAVVERQESAEFDAYRVALTDALRPLVDPEKILAEAMRVLGEKLQVDRVLYSEIAADNETILILGNYVKDGVPELSGRASLNDYGKARGPLTAGQKLVIADAATSPDMDKKDRAAFAALGIRSGLAIPLIKSGRWVATLGVHHGAVRAWTENEIKFAEETAERTWSALQHARAQEKLHASEALYRTIARSIPGGGVYVVDRDFRYLVAEGSVNEAFGLAREDLEGRTVAEVFPDERGTRMEERLQRVFAGETISFETKNKGRVFWTQLAPLLDSIGQAIILTLDITERKQAEEALRQSEERFARFMQYLPGLAWIKDAQGRYVYANAAAEKAFGMALENLYGKTDAEVFPPAVAAQFRENDEQALVNEKGVQTVETLPQDDGIVHYSLVTKFPIAGTDGKVAMIGGTAFDITERKHIEEALRIENERFMRFVDSNIVGILIGDATGNIILANDYYLNLLGVSRDEFAAGKVDWKSFTPPEWLSADEKAIHELRERGVCEPYEKEYVRTDGTRIPVYIADAMLPGAGEEIAAFVIDISERKKAEAALYESEERLRAILSQATAGIVRKDMDGKLIFVNQAYCDMLGYTEEELLGKNFWQFAYHEDIAENKRLYDRMMVEGTPFKLEKRLIRRDGSLLWVDVSVSPVLDADGKPQSAVAVEVDITGRKQAEEALQQLNLQLENRVQKRTTTIQAINQSLREEIAERKRIEAALRESEAVARSSEEKLRTLFDLLPVGITFLDPEGKVLQMNSAVLNIVRLTKEQLFNQVYKSRKYIHPDGTPMPLTEFASARALRENKTIHNVETGILLENGEVVWTSVSAAPVDVADVGVVIVTVDTTESKRAERALQESHGRLRVLSQRLVEVQEEERRALARELHDRVGQTLAALNINLIIINGQLSEEVAQQIGARLNDSMKLVAETIALVRDVMTDLRPAVLDDYGLDAALEAHLNGFKSRYNIEVLLEKSVHPIPRLGASLEMTFLRIAQEALMNIAKHAHAKHVNLSLRQVEQLICLTIQDDGIGIESWQDANRPGSHGLTIMRERAEAFGGTLQVRSVLGQGTTVEVSIPYGKNEAQKEFQEQRL